MSTSPQDIQRLIESVDKLVNAMGGRNHRKSSFSPNHSTSGLNIDKLRNNMANNSLGSQFVEEAVKMRKALSGVADIYDKLEKNTRDQSDKVRQLNGKLANIIANSTDVVKTLSDLKDTSNAVKKSFSSYSEGLVAYKKSLSELNDLARQRKDLDAKYNKAQEKVVLAQKEYDLAKKSKKNSADAQAKLLAAAEAAKSIARELSKFDDGIHKALKAHEANTEAVDKSVESIEKYNNVTGDLTDAQIIYLKNYKEVNTESEKYNKILDHMVESTKHFDKGLGHIGDVLEDRSKKMGAAFDGLKDSIKKAAWQLLTIAPKVAFGDLKSQLANGVRDSDYKHDALMGVSETERSQIIGENRTGMRVLGHGDEEQGFRNSKTMQDAAHNYGVTGADALKLAMQYQNTMINSGMGGKAEDTADQMRVMHNFSRDLGVTDEALKSFYDSLNDSGQMAALNNKYANLDEASRRKAINQEVKDRLALNTQLGISVERQKQLNQEAMNKRYGGVASAIMNKVGASMEISQFNRDNPNAKLSDKEQAAYKHLREAGGDMSTLSTEEQKDAQTARQKIAKNRSGKLADAARKGGSVFDAAEVKYIDSMRVTNPDMQANDTEALAESQRRQSLDGTNVINNQSYSDDQQDSMNKTKNAFIDLIPGMEKFNSAILDATQALQGIAANPAGQAAGTAASGMGAFLGTVAGSIISHKGGKILKKLGPKVAEQFGKKAAVEGAEKAGFSFFGKKAATVAGAAATAGAAAEGATKTGGETAAKGAEKAGFSFFGKGAEKVGGKFAAKEGEKLAAKTVGKSLLKKIPGLSILAGLGFGAYRGFHDGDWAGAGEELASGIAGTVPVIGTAASMAIDAHLAYRDYKNGEKAASVNPAVQDSIPSVAPESPTSPTLSDATKVDDSQTITQQQQQQQTQSDQIDKLNKIIKVLQDQLDLQKKDSDKKDADSNDKSGQTWSDLREHIAQVRTGLGGK